MCLMALLDLALGLDPDACMLASRGSNDTKVQRASLHFPLCEGMFFFSSGNF